MKVPYVTIKTPSLLNICLCHETKPDHSTLEKLDGLNVLLHYVDPEENIIKVWDGKIHEG